VLNSVFILKSNSKKMPIHFNLEELRDENDCKVYLESGMWDPTEYISLHKALSCKFQKVYTMEIRDDFVASAQEVFKSEISSGKLTVLHGDSSNLANFIAGNPDFNEKSLFFLDAHVDNPKITQPYKAKCPVFFELDAISNLSRKDNVICIDDVRILQTPFPWGETFFPGQSYMTLIMERIVKINEKYKFKLLDGHTKNDVLVAYV